MYETGNQKDRDKKRIVLRNPHRQRSRNATHSMAQCAECTGCRECICRAIPCHRTRCRTRHQLKHSCKTTAASRGALLLFIVYSLILTSFFFVVQMIVLSINLQRDRIYLPLLMLPSTDCLSRCLAVPSYKRKHLSKPSELAERKSKKSPVFYSSG